MEQKQLDKLIITLYDKKITMDNDPNSIPDGLNLVAEEDRPFAVLSGFVMHGGTLPIPYGYTRSQCRYIVSPKDLDSPGAGAMDWFNISVDSNGYVSMSSNGRICRSDYDSVFYLVIGIK